MNSLDRSAVLIAAKQFRFGGRSYSPGDKFDYQRLGITQRRKVIRLMESATRKIAELTPATMAAALKHRTNPRPPRGFTLAGLIGLGILTEEQIVAKGWALENRDVENEEGQAYTPPEGSWKVFAEGADEESGDYVWILPHKPGGRGATRYFVNNPEGDNLNGVGSIGGKDNAEAWGKDYLAKRARASGEDSPWKDFPEKADDFSDEQIEVFDHWFEGIGDDDDISNEPSAIQQLVAERRTASQADAEREETDKRFAAMSEAEAKDFIDGLSDEDLLSFISSQRPDQSDSLSQLSRIAQNDIAADIIADKAQTETKDGGDVQSSADDTQG